MNNEQAATNPRALGTNPRALGTNPRAAGSPAIDHQATKASQRIELDTSASIPEGVVRVTDNPDRHGNHWFLVSVGRSRYVKRFNLSDAEARQLVEQLQTALK